MGLVPALAQAGCQGGEGGEGGGWRRPRTQCRRAAARGCPGRARGAGQRGETGQAAGAVLRGGCVAAGARSGVATMAATAGLST